VLGTRRAESQIRARNMARHASKAVRDRLTPNANLNNCLVYTPIEDWSNDDVWTFLMRFPNPWGYSNKDLLTMYRGASEDGECPLVVDSTTPSCGNSRFGCWVCTLVDQDKSMAAMIRNDEEKSWMEPMLRLRNELDFRTDESKALDRARRDFRRMSGKITFYRNAAGDHALVPGPYTQQSRAYWLRRVLETQQEVRKSGPEYCRSIELITLPELQEVRRLWVIEKHEIEDLVPKIYREAIGEDYPGAAVDDYLVFDEEALAALKDVCSDDPLRYEMLRNLLDTERRFAGMAARRGLFDELSTIVDRCAFEDAKDALQFAKARRQASDDDDERLGQTVVGVREDDAGKVTMSLRQFNDSNLATD
jgi:DNA sulfur modification protein DndC